MEFKSRLAEFNNRDNRGHIYDEDKLAFDIFHEYNIGEKVCTPDTLKSHTHGKENEAPANVSLFYFSNLFPDFFLFRFIFVISYFVLLIRVIYY